jgi:hypothetical protein
MPQSEEEQTLCMSLTRPLRKEMLWSDKEQTLCMSLPRERRIQYRALWYSLCSLDEVYGIRPADKKAHLDECMEFINDLLMDKKDEIKGQYYEMRLTPVAGGAYSQSSCNHELSPYCIMYGNDVTDLRIEIFRWGRPRKWGAKGVDRYTVGEYEISKVECELHVFNLPSIIQCSDQDSGMFLGKGWASLLIHMRVLIGCILGNTFNITCGHEATAYALEHYKGLYKRDGGYFTFNRLKMELAHRALYLLMSKINTPKEMAMFQQRMNDPAEQCDRYQHLIV